MVAMPGQLFYSTQIPALWFLSEIKMKIERQVLFIDARNLGKLVDRTRKEFSDEDILKISDTYQSGLKEKVTRMN